MKFCRKCGQECEDNVQFCTSCGNNFNNPNGTFTNKEIEKGNGRGLNIVSVIFTIIHILPLLILFSSLTMLESVTSITTESDITNAVAALFVFYCGIGIGSSLGLASLIISIVNVVKNKIGRPFRVVLLVINIILTIGVLVLSVVIFIDQSLKILNLIEEFYRNKGYNFTGYII